MPESVSASIARSRTGNDGAGLPDPILSIEPWSFSTFQGRVIRTPSYRVFTTMPAGATIDRLPAFMEAALTAYRSGYGTLPAPTLALDTFVLATRPQWMKLTAQMFPDEAEGFLKIPRGGFTLHARALLYDLGTRDTLALAAHEGWHQFTQQTFADPLPTWIEEGIATQFEGYRWERGERGGEMRPLFVPWANVDRFDQVRRAQEQGRLTPLADLLSASPQDLIAGGVSTSGGPAAAALAYYGQVWALVRFLSEGEGGVYREGLAALVTDAAEGRLIEQLGKPAIGSEDRTAASLLRHRGPELFRTYFKADVSIVQAQFSAFTERITRLGARELIVAGRSPL